MARSAIEPVPIARLRRKVRVLYLAQDSVCDDAALGRLFRSEAEPNGLTGKAIRNWFFGEGSRGPDEVPGDRFNRLVEIFLLRLPHRRSFAEVRSLLLAPTEQDLVLAFFSGAPLRSWIHIVLAAEDADVTILQASLSSALGVTTRRRVFDSMDGAVKVPLGKDFRFEIPPRPGWLTIIQWGADGWYGLELDDETVILQRDDAATTLPRSPPYFCEGTAGVRRFLFIHTSQPFPPDIKETLLSSVSAETGLGSATLDRLAHLATSLSNFHMGALDVMFYDPILDEATLPYGEG